MGVGIVAHTCSPSTQEARPGYKGKPCLKQKQTKSLCDTKI
jgi:hypothetical protein